MRRKVQSIFTGSGPDYSVRLCGAVPNDSIRHGTPVVRASWFSKTRVDHFNVFDAIIGNGRVPRRRNAVVVFVHSPFCIPFGRIVVYEYRRIPVPDEFLRSAMIILAGFVKQHIARLQMYCVCVSLKVFNHNRPWYTVIVVVDMLRIKNEFLFDVRNVSAFKKKAIKR